MNDSRALKSVAFATECVVPKIILYVIVIAKGKDKYSEEHPQI